MFKHYSHSILNPWHEINDLADTFGRALGLYPDYTPKFDYPPVNVWKGENEIRLQIKLPGIKAEDIEVNINHDTLTIKGERKVDEIPAGTKLTRSERLSGNFSRSFALPFPVENDAVQANYRDGILTISLPKAKASQPRKINVAGL